MLEIRKYCPEILSKVQVWIDGGIKRGTDVVKALCLGASGVGIGRAALFGLGAGGQAGVERTLESKLNPRSQYTQVLARLTRANYSSRGRDGHMHATARSQEHFGAWP